MSSDRSPKQRAGDGAARAPTLVGTAHAAVEESGTASALATLLALMASSDSDSVRVAAAKIVLAHAMEQEERKMRKPKTAHDAERRAAIDAIARLLDELAAAKTAGLTGAAGMVADGATGTDHADA